MGRIRTIKPEFWRHEALSELPEATHILAAALLTYADDEGYFNANPKLVAAECFPLREPSTPVDESLRLLAAIGYIRLGRGDDGRRYGHIVAFATHQRVSHPSKSRIAPLGITWDGQPPPSGKPPEDSGDPPETLRPEQGTGNREQGSSVEADASTGAAGAEGVVDFAKATFDLGVKVITGAGYSERQARTFIGKCRKEAGDAETFAALREASGKTDPVSWITARLKPRPAQPDIDTLMAQALGGVQ